MALAVVLLVGAGLMLRSLWSLQRVPLGLDPTNVLTMRLALPQASYQKPEQVVSFYQRLIERVRQRARRASGRRVRALPLGSTIGDFGLMVDGYVPPPGVGAKGDWQIATDGYIEAMGERIVRGRAFTDADRTGTQLVAHDQRGDGPPLLAGPRPDRRALRIGCVRSAPGSPSSGSSPTCATTASPAS